MTGPNDVGTSVQTLIGEVFPCLTLSETVSLYAPNHVGKHVGFRTIAFAYAQTDYGVIIWAVHRLGGIIS